MKRRFMVMALALIGSSSAYAHPGHGESGSMHYWSEPQHVLPLLILAALLSVAATCTYRLRTSTRSSRSA